MSTKTRHVLRLSPEDDRTLDSLTHRTTAAKKAHVVRYALDLYFELWQHHLGHGTIVIRDTEGDLFTLRLGPVVDDGFGAPPLPEEQLTTAFQFLLDPEHNNRLDALLKSGAAPTKSAALRVAIDLYQFVVKEIEQSHSIVAVYPPAHEFSISVRGIRPVIPAGQAAQTTGAAGHSIDLSSLKSGDQITLEQIKELHESHPWGSVLIHLTALQDHADFFPIVARHLSHGTQLFYVHYDSEVLQPVKTLLQTQAPLLFEKSNDLLKLIIVSEKEFRQLEEMVVFDFLNGSNTCGFVWNAMSENGTVASQQQLQRAAQRFRHRCRTWNKTPITLPEPLTSGASKNRTQRAPKKPH